MTTILVTIAAFGVLMSAMAVGVMAGRKPLRGSCGGSEGACSCSSSAQKECSAEGGILAARAAMTPPNQLIALDRLKS